MLGAALFSAGAGVVAVSIFRNAVPARSVVALETGYEAAQAVPAPIGPASAQASPAPAGASIGVAATAPRPASGDLNCLATAVYYEARGETPEGQAAVAQVVLNRARHPHYPKSVCAVVYQGRQVGSCQFSFVCNGAMRHTREPHAWTRARTVAARALEGYVMTAVGHATRFRAARLGPVHDGHGGRVIKVGGQVFYASGGFAEKLSGS